MFSSLGGSETVFINSKGNNSNDDEFGLDQSTPSISQASYTPLEHLLDADPIDNYVNHLGEDEKGFAISQLHRRHALRNVKIANWAKLQCSALQAEYISCLNSSFIPYFGCLEESFLFENCLTKSKETIMTEKRNAQARQISIYQEIAALFDNDPNTKEEKL